MDSTADREKMERRWKKFQQNMGYTDEELAIFRSNPQYTKVVEYAPKFLTHQIVVEVVEAHNCGCGHKAGDRIAVMDGSAHLLTKKMPEHVCAFALMIMIPKVYSVWERFNMDLDTRGMLFDHTHCPDVGCKNGGWGEIIMKIYAEEIPKP
jgi:uncharacterized repeat protein (TIGR04076 family)